MVKTDSEDNKEGISDDSADSLEKKLELDKLEVALKKKKSSTPTVAPSPAETPEIEEEPTEAHPKRRFSPKALIICGGALLFISLLVVLFFLWKGGAFSSVSEEVSGTTDPYVDIGPITVAFGEPEETFTISLKAHSAKSGIRQEIIEKEEILKSKLTGFLSSETAKEIIQRKEFAKLKSLLMVEINNTIGSNSVDKIYYSKLLFE